MTMAAVENQYPGTLPQGWQGAVYVEVVAAVEKEWHESGFGRMRQAFPALRVTTYTDTARESSEGVKDRGRVYHVDNVHVFGEAGGVGGWTYDSRDYYTKGLRNASGASVDWKSPMRSKLYALTEAVRDAWVADNPDWARRSLSLRLEWQIRNEEREAAGKRREAEEHDARAGKLRAELEAL
jgi:hypothetical protein